VALIPLMAAVSGATVRQRCRSLALRVRLLGRRHSVDRLYGEDVRGVSWPLALLALGIAAGIYAVPMSLMAGWCSGRAPDRCGDHPDLGRSVGGAGGVPEHGLRLRRLPWILLGSALADHPALVQSAALAGSP